VSQSEKRRQNTLLRKKDNRTSWPVGIQTRSKSETPKCDTAVENKTGRNEPRIAMKENKNEQNERNCCICF